MAEHVSGPAGMSEASAGHPNKPKTTTIFVDSEPVETEKKVLTVREILTLSGNTPPENFFLVEYRGQGQKELRHDDLSEEIHIHESQRFAAGFKGETPLS